MRIQHLVALVAVVVTTTMCGGSGGGYATGPSTGGTTTSGGNSTYGDPGTSNSCTPGATTVCLTPSNTFDPASITVKAGSTVTWSNTTGVTHNVTFDQKAGAPPNGADFASGTFAATFATAGTYPYHCTIHGLSMSGTVVVQ